MKIVLSKSNKILIGVALFTYLVAMFFGSLGIILHIVVIGGVIKILAKSKKNGELATFDLTALTVFLFLFILVRIGILWNGYNDYRLKNEYEKKLAAEITPIPSEYPTPTIYICPTKDKKTQTDLEVETAENNLSSYEIKEMVESSGQNTNGTVERTTIVDILEKKLLPAQAYDDSYSQISNQTGENSWTIRYPKEWKLYRIKRKQTQKDFESQPLEFYDLKFEHLTSYFYLREIVTMGGQPIALAENQWEQLKKSCSVSYSNTSNGGKNYICSGNVIACAGNMEGDRRILYPINSYYKSLLFVNGSSIYDWYISSLLFDRNLSGERALRVYTLSHNFYSNDEQFISELKKIYISLQGAK